MTAVRRRRPAYDAVARITLILLVVSVALTFSGAFATPGAEAASLASQVKALQKSMKKLKAQTRRQKSRIVTLESGSAAQEGRIASLNATVAAQAAQLAQAAPLLALAPYVSVTNAALNGMKGPNIVFNGVNVHVRDGSGATNCNPGHPGTPGRVTGLGNLVVGYNEYWVGQTASTRTGANNLIVGTEGTMTSVGCLVAGRFNRVTNAYASILGGYHNSATGLYSTVAGGNLSISAGSFSTVAGGQNNFAGGDCSAVGGGQGMVTGLADRWIAKGVVTAP
jgi:hypothetical protein